MMPRKWIPTGRPRGRPPRRRHSKPLVPVTERTRRRRRDHTLTEGQRQLRLRSAEFCTGELVEEGSPFGGAECEGSSPEHSPLHENMDQGEEQLYPFDNLAVEFYEGPEDGADSNVANIEGVDTAADSADQSEIFEDDRNGNEDSITADSVASDIYDDSVLIKAEPDDSDYKDVQKTYIEDFIYSNTSSFDEGSNSNFDDTKEKNKGPPLSRFPKIVKSVESADYATLQVLYGLLYQRSAWDTQEILIQRILEFSGFTFGQHSEDFYNREFMLKMEQNDVLIKIGAILGLDEVPKSSSDIDKARPELITSIMKFLTRPGRRPRALKIKGDDGVSRSQQMSCGCHSRCFNRFSKAKKKRLLEYAQELDSKKLLDSYLASLMDCKKIVRKSVPEEDSKKIKKEVYYIYRCKFGKKESIVCKGAFTTLHGIKLARVKQLQIKMKSGQKLPPKIDPKDFPPIVADESESKSTQPKTTVPVVSPKKPKTYSLNRSGDTRLGGFPHIKKNIETVQTKSLRNLYPLLFDKNFPNQKIEMIKRRILSFRGFDFKKSSAELLNRKRFLKSKTHYAIAEICEILDIKVGSKYDMISDIIKFLLKPAQILVSLVDPFHSSMQPVVNLERMNLDRSEKTQQSAKRKSLSQKIPKIQAVEENELANKRKRFPSTKLNIYISDINPSKRKSSVSEKDSESSTKIEKKQESKDATKVAKTAKGAPKKITESQSKDKDPKLSNTKGKIAVKGPTQSSLARKKLVKLAIQGRKAKAAFLPPSIEADDTSPVGSPIAEETEEPMPLPEGEIKIKSEPIIGSYYEVNDNMDSNEMEENDGSAEKSDSREEDVSAETSENLERNEDSSSDSTLSSDEMKEQSNKGSGGDLWVKRGKTSILGKVDSSTKRIVQRRYGKPLSSFPKIKENILNADYKALLRVHILLFGASDKAEKNVRNILAFGGFPFLEGSEEWKQKEFLLSLLAHNNLQEYMTLLCIQHSEDDDVTSMIKKLMKFLAAPNDKNELTPV